MLLIDSKKGNMEVEGTKVQLMAEVTMMLRQLIEREILDNADVNECAKLATMSKEDLEKKSKEAAEEQKEKLRKEFVEMGIDDNPSDMILEFAMRMISHFM